MGSIVTVSPSISFFGSAHGRFLVLSLVLLFVGSVGLDQVSKAHMHKTLLAWEDPADPDLYRGNREPVFTLGNKEVGPGQIPLYFQLQLKYSRNRGAAFSMLADLPDKVRVPFFYAVTLAAVVMIGFYLRSTPYQQHATRCGLVFILSGAIGNFLDRFNRGYVIDFIDTNWNLFGWQHDFAIFNIADVAINVGVFLLLFDMLLVWLRERKAPQPTSAA